MQFLLALVASVNRCPIDHYRLEGANRPDGLTFLMSLDGGPKIYIFRKNRQTWTVSAAGYAFHGRDLAACYYLIGMAQHMGEYNRDLSRTPAPFWESVAQTARKISECAP